MMIKKRALVLAAVIACLFVAPSSALSYEFHLLGGMVVEGELQDFREGVFYLDTEFGEMTINAANLDYIIVEPDDVAGPRGVHEGVLEFGIPPGTKEWEPERVEVPRPLEGYSVYEGEPAYPGAFRGAHDEEVPEALAGHSIRGAQSGYPGKFRGAAEGVGPQPLENHSVQEADLPSRLRVTADDYAGAYMDMEGTRLPKPFVGYSVIGDEEAAEAYPGRFMPEPRNTDAGD